MPKKIHWSSELVTKFWNGVAQTRLDEISFSRLGGARLLDFVADYLVPGNRCLDFGAGNGKLVELLIKRGCRAAAFEPSPDRRAMLSRMEFTSSPDFLGLIDDKSDETFDLVIAAEVIEHILDEDLDHVIDRIHRFLKPGGILIVTTPHDEDLDLNSVYCPVSDTIFHRWQHVRSFTAESLNALFAQRGFERLHDHRVDYSDAGSIYDEYVKLKHAVKYMRFIGPIYYLVAPWLSKRSATPDLRVGAQSGLVYIGRAI